MSDLSSFEPGAWADAILKIATTIGVEWKLRYVVPLLIAWLIFWKYNPWRKKE